MKKDKEYRKQQRRERGKQKALERQADKILKRDEEFQKLKEHSNNPLTTLKFKTLQNQTPCYIKINANTL